MFYILFIYTYKSKFPFLANDSIVFVKTLEILFPNIAKLFILNICCSQQESDLVELNDFNLLTRLLYGKIEKYFSRDKVRLYYLHLVVFSSENKFYVSE